MYAKKLSLTSLIENKIEEKRSFSNKIDKTFIE